MPTRITYVYEKHGYLRYIVSIGYITVVSPSIEFSISNGVCF